MKCLIVDDSSVTRRIAVRTLRALGFEPILEASDGQSALQMCDASVELVLTDWNMPGLGGLDLIRSLRAKPELHDVPVLLITSRQMRQDVVEAALAGVNGYVIKPFTPEVLRERIQDVLEKHRSRHIAEPPTEPPDATSGDVAVAGPEPPLDEPGDGQADPAAA